MNEQLQGISDDYELPPESTEQTTDDFDEEAVVSALSDGDWEDPSDDAYEGEDAAMAEEVQSLGVNDNLVEIFNDIEGQLLQKTFDEEGDAIEATDFEGEGNIVGVGFGIAEDDFGLDLDPGATCLNVYVAEPMSMDDAKSVIVDSMGISAASDDKIPVNVVVTGMLDAQHHRFKIRPAPGGVSVGHFRITAGTLGCLATGRRAPRNHRLMVLSNNHVLANSNNARFGDCITQPGRHDGGRCDRDRIAILERFCRIRFGGAVNYVDAATGWAWPNRVRKEMVYRSPRGLRLLRISSSIRRCQRGLIVGKTGRTTQLTRGRIVDCNASLWVNYGGGRKAFFRDQIVVRGIGKVFSRGGDSGSVIWTWDGRRNPVGLLFAGNASQNYTIANKMWRVLRCLDIRLIT